MIHMLTAPDDLTSGALRAPIVAGRLTADQVGYRRTGGTMDIIAKLDRSDAIQAALALQAQADQLAPEEPEEAGRLREVARRLQAACLMPEPVIAACRTIIRAQKAQESR